MAVESLDHSARSELKAALPSEVRRYSRRRRPPAEAQSLATRPMSSSLCRAGYTAFG